MDYRLLSSWVIVTALLIGIPGLLRWPYARRVIGAWLGRLGAWVIDRLNPPPEFDQVADDLARVLRRERLSSDLRRLERIIATDMSMSATRQLGNRIAYAWLQRELERNRSLWPAADRHSWSDSDGAEPIRTMNPSGSGAFQHRPRVETIEIGWRR